MTVWRLQVNTGGANIADYCLKNHVAAMGWSLDDIPENDRISIKTFDDYDKLAEAIYKNYSSVERFYYEVKENDIIWMRSSNEGKYYLGRVKADSKWIFNQNAIDIDAANQRINIDWYEATDMADEESVPGAVSTAFIMGSTLQRIKKSGVEAYSQLLLNKLYSKSGDPFRYPNPDLSLTEEYFYSLLQPEDVEDLLALWLYDTKGYVCIPSTNKIATPKYECVLVDPSDTSRKHIYIQVKKGNVDLNADDYCNLKGEIYLLTTEGKIINDGKYLNIISVDSSTIFQFAIDPDKSHIIPENVLYWVKFLTDVENAKLPQAECKGIMLDTNQSYSDTNEYEMLSQSKISAYGDAKRYISSFSKGDYALFYSKGRGIIAIGRISSDTPTDVNDERYHNVEMIIPKSFSGDIESLKALSPSEIKVALDKNFYWASTIKTPFLDKLQAETLIKALEKKYIMDV
ncbi:hypothetical protein [Butyrivibrio sp. MB2005]|uniref:hypothetical protein n=1 Tax=Butyrivibrio sp. MB2005 TaxID=1280678 RepID=UPI00041A4E1B|nr:hypothetical protein [Butyrivibrio sp. MB2005]